MALLSRRSSCGYSKIEREDPEETKHRLAQFLIYKALEKVDSRTRQSYFSVRVCKLKIKMGKRLKRLRKTMSEAKRALYKQVLRQVKRLLRGGQTVFRLPPTLSC